MMMMMMMMKNSPMLLFGTLLPPTGQKMFFYVSMMTPIKIHLIDTSSPVLNFLFPTLLCELVDHFKLLHLTQVNCVALGKVFPIDLSIVVVPVFMMFPIPLAVSAVLTVMVASVSPLVDEGESSNQGFLVPAVEIIVCDRFNICSGG